jgi:hypothetical protein
VTDRRDAQGSASLGMHEGGEYSARVGSSGSQEPAGFAPEVTPTRSLAGDPMPRSVRAGSLALAQRALFLVCRGTIRSRGPLT